LTVTRVSKRERERQDPFLEFRELVEEFNEAFELLEIFQSTARMKMMLMMSRGPTDTTSMRKTVNPKLVYENIALMRDKKLIEEVEDRAFNLTEVGRKILAEYLHFLESLEKAMWEG
jgi:predicted transcriptional regulator